jgi:hypothetical protein
VVGDASMKLLSSYDGAKFGDGYEGIRSQVYYNAQQANGSTSINGAQWPKLSNGQVIALVQAWRRAAARSARPSWPLSFDLLRSALGWSQAGDRFVMSREHASALAPPELLQMFWTSTGDIAQQLDDANTKRMPLIVDHSYAGYEQAARDAWREMQAAGIVIPTPGGPLPVPDPVTPPTPPLPQVPSVGGGGMLLLLLIAAVAFSRRKK